MSADPKQTDLDDAEAVALIRAGRTEGLKALMDRYDRLARYAIFRLSRSHCLRDPAWLDTLAHDVWTGFVQSVRSGAEPRSVKSYLLNVTRNRTISELRRSSRRIEERSETLSIDLMAPEERPEDVLAHYERLEALRSCREELNEEDRRICSQLEALLDRKWREAAERLNVPESTLRYRWDKIITRLKRCVGKKLGEPFAPPP